MFTSQRDGDLEIYVMDATGSNPVNLSNAPSNDDDPAWSPDGTQIAYWHSRAGERGHPWRSLKRTMRSFTKPSSVRGTRFMIDVRAVTWL